MRVSRLLFLIVVLPMSWAELMPGTSYAAPSEQTEAESFATTPVARNRSKEQISPRHVSDKNHPRSRISLTAANHPKQLPNGRKRSIPGNVANLHQHGSDKSGAAGKGALTQNERARKATPVRPTAATLNASLNLSRNNVRHRGPNSAVVSGSAAGSANLNSSNTGAINGTHMHRKP